MTDTLHDEMVENARAPLAKKLDTFSRGLFFVWIGVVFLANVGWGVGLLGVALITLGTQAARKYLDVPVERFWLVMGVAIPRVGRLRIARRSAPRVVDSRRCNADPIHSP